MTVSGVTGSQDPPPNTSRWLWAWGIALALLGVVVAVALFKLQEDRARLRDKVAELEKEGAGARTALDADRKKMDDERAEWKTKHADLDAELAATKAELDRLRERAGLVVTQPLTTQDNWQQSTDWSLSVKNGGSRAEYVHAVLYCFRADDFQVKRSSLGTRILAGEEKKIQGTITWPPECLRKIAALHVYASENDKEVLIAGHVD